MVPAADVEAHPPRRIDAIRFPLLYKFALLNRYICTDVAHSSVSDTNQVFLPLLIFNEGDAGINSASADRWRGEDVVS
jgi:hypothetical protein